MLFLLLYRLSNYLDTMIKYVLFVLFSQNNQTGTIPHDYWHASMTTKSFNIHKKNKTRPYPIQFLVLYFNVVIVYPVNLQPKAFVFFLFFSFNYYSIFLAMRQTLVLSLSSIFFDGMNGIYLYRKKNRDKTKRILYYITHVSNIDFWWSRRFSLRINNENDISILFFIFYLNRFFFFKEILFSLNK